MPRRAPAIALALTASLAGCSGDEGASPATAPATTTPAVPSTTAVITIGGPGSPTTATTTTSTSTSTTTSLPPTTTLHGELLGRSVEGRPITVVRHGTPGGRAVLVIGVIHGNEAAGAAIVDELETLPVPEGIELFLVRSMNPDGQAANRRTNANLVDLNRNFPEAWSPLGEPGDGQYSGPSAGSEPETQAISALIRRVQPELVVWYHQDLYRISPATGRNGRVRERYAALTGLPIVPITGGTYTGTASGWAKKALPNGVSFLVELGPDLTPAEARTHAEAVLTVAAELPGI